MTYKIYCNQRSIYFADGAEFETLAGCLGQLRDYHSYDCDEDSLAEQSLADICNGFEWSIHDKKGDEVDYEVLEAIK